MWADWSVFDMTVTALTLFLMSVAIYITWSDFIARPDGRLSMDEHEEVEELKRLMAKIYLTQEQWIRLEELERKMEGR